MVQYQNPSNKGVPEQNTLYVGKHGDDSNAGTTIQNAFLTVQAAITAAGSDTTVVVLPGTYTEDLTISSPISLTGVDPLNSHIGGNVTVSHNTGTVFFKDMYLSNTNDHVIEQTSTSVNGVLSISNCYFVNTWTTGAGQTVDTSKAVIKVSGGTYRQRTGFISIITSGDNTSEHNTSSYWITGTNEIMFESLEVEHNILNTTDDSQNLEVVFNNNTNTDSGLFIQNGKMKITGVVDGDNYLAPFYNHDGSDGKCSIEGNVIRLLNSGNAYCAFHYNSDTKTSFSNNSIFPESISSLYLASEYSGAGSINCANCYFDVSTLPSVNGDVDYTVILDNGNLYSSAESIADTFSTSTAATGLTITDNTIVADGTDANIDMNITPKGTGSAIISKVDIGGGEIDGVIIGANSSAAGTFNGLTDSSRTQHALAIYGASGVFSEIGPLTDGQIIVGSSGNAAVATQLTAGTGINIGNAAGSITISGSGGGMSWTGISANQTLAVNNGYFCTGGTDLSLALPSTSSVGDKITVALDGSTSWTITQAAGQQIRLGSNETTSGATGSLASTAQGDSVTMLCVTADSRWICACVTGNITLS